MKVQTEKLNYAKGYVRDLKVDKKEKYNLYKFFLTETINKDSPGTFFSGFNLDIKEGQLIEFEWKTKGEYKNVETSSVITYENLETVTKKDIISTNPKDELLIEYLKLYGSAVHICMKNNTVTDEEIKAQFTRLQKLINIEKVFEGIQDFIKEKYG